MLIEPEMQHSFEPGYKSGMQLTVKPIVTLEGHEPVVDEWAGVFDHCTDATPFQSPGWLVPWWHHFGKKGLRIITLRNNNKLVGIAPLFIYKNDSGRRVLCFLGSGISDYLDVLAEPGFERECATAAFSWISETESEWDECDLQELRPESWLIEAAVGPGLKRLVEPSSVCSSLHLSNEDEDPASVLSRKFRKNLRHLKRELIDTGILQLAVADPPEIHLALDELFALHQARWNSKDMPGVLADNTLQAFHRKSAQALLSAGLLRMYTLRFGSAAIAAYYILIKEQVAYLYIGGFDPDYERFSPGSLALYLIIIDLLHTGVKTFDFLRGDELYKRQWQTKVRTNFRVRLFHNEKGESL